MCLCISLKVATKYYFGGKKIGKVSISDAKILKGNRKNVTKVIYKISKNFGLSLVSSATYFLEVSLRISLRVVTNSLFRDKKNPQKIAFLTLLL